MPRILAENSGHNPTDVISNLYAAHQAGKVNEGLDVETGGTLDASAAGIYDLLSSKVHAIKLATDAAVTILRVDQVRDHDLFFF